MPVDECQGEHVGICPTCGQDATEMEVDKSFARERHNEYMEFLKENS